MKYKLLMIIISFLLISSCSSQNTLPEVDNTGTGLDIDMNFDTSRFTLNGNLKYSITITNTGRETIELKKSQFKLSTVEKLEDNSILITKESLDNFYDELFRGSDTIPIFQNQEIGPIQGSFFIKEEYAKNDAKTDFTITVDINYPYTTEFENNIIVNKNSNQIMKIQDSITQAAPIGITDISLEQTSVSDFILELTLEDKASNLGRTKITFSEKEFKFGAKSINFEKCEYIGVNRGSNRVLNELALLDQFSKTLIRCELTFDNSEFESDTNTIISGKLDYDYSISIEEKIKIPIS